MPRYVQLDDIRQEFLERVFRVVWCSAATVDSHGRPRSRILHPYWEGDANGGLIGWIATVPTSPKAKHLAAKPYMSLAYVAEMNKPVYAECRAEWVDDLAVKQRVHDLFLNAPAPMGYDTVPIFGGIDSPRYGILKLTPYQVEVSTFPGEHTVWRADRT